MPGLVDARLLTGGADEEAGEQKGQRGLIVPEGEETAKQIGPPQKGAVRRGRAPNDDVVAATGAGLTAVDQEFFHGQARLTGGFVERGGAVHDLPPVVHGLDVDLNDAGVRGDLQTFHPWWVKGWGVPPRLPPADASPWQSVRWLQSTRDTLPTWRLAA